MSVKSPSRRCAQSSESGTSTASRSKAPPLAHTAPRRPPGIHPNSTSPVPPPILSQVLLPEPLLPLNACAFSAAVRAPLSARDEQLTAVSAVSGYSPVFQILQTHLGERAQKRRKGDLAVYAISPHRPKVRRASSNVVKVVPTSIIESRSEQLYLRQPHSERLTIVIEKLLRIRLRKCPTRAGSSSEIQGNMWICRFELQLPIPSN